MSNIKTYLAVYNLTAFLFWGSYMVFFVLNKCSLDSTSLILLNIAQGLALFEIFHALLKWVKSPLASTVAQVASRIFVLVLINVFFEEELKSVVSIGIIIVSFAWGITEVIRYGYYFLTIINNNLKWVEWMRYSFFIVLYPLGITGEWLIIAGPIVNNGFEVSIYNMIAAGLFIAYLYYFPVLYKYMFKQRKIKLQLN